MSIYDDDEDLDDLDDEDFEDDDDHDTGEIADMTDEKINAEGIQFSIPTNALDTIANAAAERIARHVSESVKSLVAKRIESMLDDAWKETVTAQAQQAMLDYLTKPRSKTNQWGEPVSGEQTALSSLIPGVVEKWLNEKVDDKGNLSSYSGAVPRLQWMLKSLVTDQLQATTEKAARDVTEKARAIVAGHVGRFISEQMVPSIEAKL